MVYGISFQRWVIFPRQGVTPYLGKMRWINVETMIYAEYAPIGLDDHIMR